MPRRVLILFAHPALHKSRVNRRLAAAVRDVEGVTFHDLYAAYPDLLIDVPREQELLLGHDVVVFQHPFYWYSTPSIMKEWCDLVLEYGFAYGEKGTRLQGKAWIHALTAGGPDDAYEPKGYNRYSVRQLLTPLEQTANLCGMPFLPPFAVHGTLKLDLKTEVPRIAAQYRSMVEKLRDTTIAWDQLPKWERINEHLDALVTGPSAGGGGRT